MAADSIKKQIVARILAVLDPLKVDQVVRAIERRRGFNVTDLSPSIDFIVGEEVKTEDDNVGITMEFPFFLKLNVTGKNCYDLADDLVSIVQTQIESDRQLAGLCNFVDYHGDTPFTNDGSPEGGTILNYQVQYRRQRARPEVKY